MRENEYAIVERVLSLLLLLSREANTREQVFERIPAYGLTTDRASHRMFERDIACLQRLGFQVERERGVGRFATYWIGGQDHV